MCIGCQSVKKRQKIFNEEEPDEEDEHFDVFTFDRNEVIQENQTPIVSVNTDDLSYENHAVLVEAAANLIIGLRETVTEGQAKQAEKMLMRSQKVLAEVSIGDYVTLPIPDVDRSVSSAPNLICRIVDIICDKGLHEFACEAGVLSILFARNCFEKLKSSELDVVIKCDKKVSVREVASVIDIGGGQGLLKCQCTLECLTGRCKCKAAKLK